MKTKKRCESIAPMHGDQCTKPRSHIKKEIAVTHQAGCLFWGPGDEAIVRVKPDFNNVGEALRKAMAAHPQLPFGGLDVGLVAAQELQFPLSDPGAELAEWWRDQAEAEIGPTVDKAIEYGSTDLIDIGMMLGRTIGRDINEEEAAELGVFFYLIGKIARWQSSIQRGERPSDDTLFDIGVYVRMAQRIRESGGWPGVEKA